VLPPRQPCLDTRYIVTSKPSISEELTKYYLHIASFPYSLVKTRLGGVVCFCRQALCHYLVLVPSQLNDDASMWPVVLHRCHPHQRLSVRLIRVTRLPVGQDHACVSVGQLQQKTVVIHLAYYQDNTMTSIGHVTHPSRDLWRSNSVKLLKIGCRTLWTFGISMIHFVDISDLKRVCILIKKHKDKREQHRERLR